MSDDLAERDVEALGLFAIDGDDVLRIVCGVSGEEAGEIFLRALPGGANEVMSGFVEVLQGVTALIEQFVLKSAKLAETLDGGRFEGNDDGAGDSEERAAKAIQDGSGGMLFSLALRVRTKRQEDKAGVGRGAAEAEAGDRKSALNFRDIFCDGGDLPADIASVFERGPGGSLDGDDEITLVFSGNEALRNLAEDEISETEADDEKNERDGFKAEKDAKSAHVAAC